MAERDNAPPLPSPPTVFWHVCCINHWRTVVREQLRVLAHVGLMHVRVGMLGDPGDALYLRREAAYYGVDAEVMFTLPDNSLWERPTLGSLWEYARSHQNEAILYLHSKAVTQPHDKHKEQWRRAMARYSIGQWVRTLDLLRHHDFSGLCWQELADFPHFCGNFWMARADWIANLQPIEEYRTRHGPEFRWASHPWGLRMCCETWLGSEPWHHVDAYTRNGNLWEGSQVFGLPTDIDGFSYHQSSIVR